MKSSNCADFQVEREFCGERLFLLANNVEIADNVLQVTPFEESDTVEADIHGDDSILAEGKDGVDTRLAIGIVAPVEINGETKDSSVRKGVEEAIAEPAMFILGEGRASTEVGEEGGDKVNVSADHETSEGEDVDGLVISAANHGEGAEEEIFSDDKNDGHCVPEVEGSRRIGHISVELLLVFAKGSQHEEYR